MNSVQSCWVVADNRGSRKKKEKLYRVDTCVVKAQDVWVIQCWGVSVARVSLVTLRWNSPVPNVRHCLKGKERRCGGLTASSCQEWWGPGASSCIWSSALILFHPDVIFAYNQQARYSSMRWHDLLECKEWWGSLMSSFYIWLIGWFNISCMAMTRYGA